MTREYMTREQRRSSGFIRFPRPSDAEIRLFCFPYAGGSAQVFEEMARQLPPEIEAVGVDYPGRRSRFAEPPIADLSKLTADLAIGIRPLLDRPFAFYGHSNGALVAFELARVVSRSYFRLPDHLFLGAKRCPLLGREAPLHRLPDTEFVEMLRGYQGTPEQVLQCPDLMQMLIPILRADFALSETYEMAGTSTIVDVPVTAIAGEQDNLAAPETMQVWDAICSAPFTLQTIDAGHFFISSHLDDVLQIITTALQANVRFRTTQPNHRRTVQC